MAAQSSSNPSGANGAEPDAGDWPVDAVEVDFGNLLCKLIDIDTLIAAKRSAGRPHDLRTIAFLEEIKRRRSEWPSTGC